MSASPKRLSLRSIKESAAPFSNSSFRKLWTGQMVSAAGNAMTSVALVFGILGIGGTASDIGLVFTAQTIPRLIFVLVGGVWADRLPRQLVMLGSDVLQVVVQGTIAVLLFTGSAEVWHLAIGAGCAGLAQAFFGPASAGLLPEVLPSGQLQQGNALMNLSRGFFTVLGPALSGLLISLSGAQLVFAIDAVTFLVSAITLRLLVLPPREPAPREAFLTELKTGWQEVVARRWFWLTLIAHGWWNLAIAAYFVLGPVIADDHLGGASSWGAIAASWAAGSFTGALVALNLQPKRPLVAGNVAMLLTTAPMLAMVQPQPTMVISAAAFLAGVGLMFLTNVWNATIQTLVPDQVLSRVDSYDWLLSMVVAPLGLALVGPIADQIGRAPTLTVAVVSIGVVALAIAALPPVRAVRRTADGQLLSGQQGDKTTDTPDLVTQAEAT